MAWQKDIMFGKCVGYEMIIIDCNGGLGNRLLPILSCLSTEKECRIHWAINSHCSLEVQKIFKLEHLQITLDEVFTHSYFYLILRGIYSTSIYLEKIKQLGRPLDEDIDIFLQSSNTLFFSHHNVLESNKVRNESYPEIFNNLLNDEIKEKALSIKNKLKLDKNVIGCHLRATDLLDMDIKSIIKEILLSSDSITTKFRAIKNKISDYLLHKKRKSNMVNNLVNRISNSKKRFFISSDEKMFENELGKLPNVIVNKKKNYPELKKISNYYLHRAAYRDQNTIKESLIDMCCLSFCSCEDDSLHFYPKSTFLATAKYISGWEKYHNT